MGVLLGALSSLVLGTADFFGGKATQRADGFAVVFFGSLVALPVALIGALVIDGSFGWSNIALGLLAGVGSGIGLGSLYRGFAAASTSVVAPIAAVLSAFVPVAYDMFGGTRLSSVGLAGVVIGLAALALTTWSPEIAGRVTVGVGFGVVAGLGLGFGLTVLGQVSNDAGVWPVVGRRITVMAVAGIVASVAGVVGIPTFSIKRLALYSGALSAIGVALFVAGAQRGDLASVAVAGSQFPAVTVGLAAVFSGERLRWWQIVGLGAAIVGISLIALG